MKNRKWISPPNVIVKKNKNGGPQKISYWVDDKNEPMLYTKDQIAILNVLTNLNMQLIKALVLLDNASRIDKNAKIKTLISQDKSKYVANKSSLFNNFISLMAAVPDVTFGEFLNFISNNTSPKDLLKMGKKAIKNTDVFYSSDIYKRRKHKKSKQTIDLKDHNS